MRRTDFIADCTSALLSVHYSSSGERDDGEEAWMAEQEERRWGRRGRVTKVERGWKWEKT